MRFEGVVVDYGHGGLIDGEYQTSGAKQYTFTDHDNWWVGEGVVNRQIAAKLIALLIEQRIPVYDCVAKKQWTVAPSWEELQQKDVSLVERVAYANQHHKCVFLSLHANAIGDGIEGKSQAPRGVSFFTSKGQTGSDVVASRLYAAFTEALKDEDMRVRRGNWEDGDQDHEASFYVLRKTWSSAVLGEVGFFTNWDDAQYLTSEDGQRVIARAYLNGVLSFLR